MMSPNPPVNDGQGLPDERIRALVDEYGPALRRYFTKRVGPTDADDLVQEVFVKLYVRSRGDLIDANIESYIFRIAASVLVDRHRQPFRSREWTTDSPEGALEQADDLSPERALIAKERLARVIVAMQELPPVMRRAFLLHRFEDTTYATIARRRGVSVKAVEKMIGQALKRLAAAMEERS